MIINDERSIYTTEIVVSKIKQNKTKKDLFKYSSITLFDILDNDDRRSNVDYK